MSFSSSGPCQALMQLWVPHGGVWSWCWRCLHEDLLGAKGSLAPLPVGQ